jgi:hypothetical protein
VSVLTQSLERSWPRLGWILFQPVVLSAAATLYLAISYLCTTPDSLLSNLGDTDDALRLVSVRELLAGASWFDTTITRVGAPEPLVSHWSRLIDGALAGLMLVSAGLLGAEQAELAGRIAWPLLLFFLVQWIVVREAERRGGRWAAVLAVVFTITCATALFQFRPGRVDHHNAQILCAIAGLLFLTRGFQQERYGWIAGAWLALGLAIGYEPLALVLPAAGLAALLAAWRPEYIGAIARTLTAAAAVLFAALILTLPPSHWLSIKCDALSLNMPLLVCAGAAGAWLLARHGHTRPRSLRFATLGLSGFVGLLLFAILEPACLAGPFGQVSPALGPIWLTHVAETKPILWLAHEDFALAFAFVLFVLAGTLAQIALWRTRRDAGNGFYAALVAFSLVLGCWQIKLMPYASWLVIVPLAVLAARLQGGAAALSGSTARLGAVVLLNQTTLAAFADSGMWAVRQAAGLAPSRIEREADAAACFRRSNFRRLAGLPPGLVVADIDFGSFIVAHTPHRVVGAPYHRLDKGILATHRILTGAPETARREIKALGIDYVVLCRFTSEGRPHIFGKPEAGSLRARLLAAEHIDFLREEPSESADPVLKVWRVTPGR